MLTAASGHLRLLLQLLARLMHGLAGVSCFDQFLGGNSTRLQVGAFHHLDVLKVVSGRRYTIKPICRQVSLLKHELSITSRVVSGGLHGPVLVSVRSVGSTVRIVSLN